MGVITYVFIALAFINAISCAPVDDSTAKPPAINLSSSTTPTSEHFEESKKQTPPSKVDSVHSSEESKESTESSEENKKRPLRDTENSGVIAHQTKDLPQGEIRTPPPVTKEAPKPQLPARETRETNEQVAVPAGEIYDRHNIKTSWLVKSRTAGSVFPRITTIQKIDSQESPYTKKTQYEEKWRYLDSTRTQVKVKPQQEIQIWLSVPPSNI